MPGTLTVSLFVISAAALAVTMIGERLLGRTDWSRLEGLRIRWSQPETRLLMVTLAAAIGSFTAMAAAFTSYGFELYAMARSEPDATERPTGWSSPAPTPPAARPCCATRAGGCGET